MQLFPRALRFGELDQVFPIVLRLLRFFRAWGSRRRLLGLYGFFAVHFSVRLLPLIVYLDTSDMQTLIRHLGEIVFVGMLYPVFVVYVWKIPKLIQLVEILDRAFAKYDQPKEFREEIVKTNKFVRNICRFYFVYTGANIPVYIVAPILLTFWKYLRWNNPNEPFYFDFPNELPLLNHLNMWHYVICEVLIAPVFFCSAIFLALKSMLYYSLLQYVSLMFKLVLKRIQLLDKSLSHRRRRRQLNRQVDAVVKHHYLALKCAAILEELISPILLAQFLGCVIVWCMLIFYMTMSIGDFGALTTLILCEILAFEMLAFSFFGSELTHVSSSVATEIYNFRWYDAPLAIQRKVLLISVRSQRIVGVTAFKFYYVTIEQFGKAVQTTYSFYLVMKKLFEGQ
ncbi:conserved hypothetical protein [Culex quinquefasciatus]|uniref:Odorant receptor n=1 Tax=Culex quinquefasciatus TaxID=7176 RepID=B0WAY2_CULQU|nr:conserved hypothetical protein [Culex quinquefasciatus]|eukprot:XP_001845866.1 conserved hypothetical protein [Culex quinquefasciatus]